MCSARLPVTKGHYRPSTVNQIGDSLTFIFKVKRLKFSDFSKTVVLCPKAVNISINVHVGKVVTFILRSNFQNFIFFTARGRWNIVLKNSFTFLFLLW